ncbi:hypothetical protein [Actinomadura sp. HBU206391]|uniref:hypothetical protein n=1 Tax=Actinomadura sp. HBU206391 TaxID=2731692 RepID=UPI00164FCD52|nr:hypothetical protein [Actinomadura sp. HBU206391]MBC6457579.1 hypothetical protein [Actinomadura sp. HBU206391]
MRLSTRRRETPVPTLQLPEGAGADEVEPLLRRYDPDARRRRRRIRVAGPVTVICDGETLRVRGGGHRLARGLHHHLGGTWLVAPPEPGEHDEQIEDMLRIYVPRKLLPAEPAMLLRPFLPGVAIREDAALGLFWFNDEDSELTISARDVDAADRGPLAAALGQLAQADALYECGIDDVHGPTEKSAEQAWRIARAFEEMGGVPIDRYGFRVARASDLLTRRSGLTTP